jgi:hypothetical protein
LSAGLRSSSLSGCTLTAPLDRVSKPGSEPGIPVFEPLSIGGSVIAELIGFMVDFLSA